jgi:hypothetical protein
MLKPPVDAATYPVTALIEAFGLQIIASVAAVPVAVVVTTVAHDPEPIAPVPRAEVPEAIVTVPALVQDVPESLRSAHANRATVIAPPELVCFKT